MTPADLASHYSADDLLAALCAKLSPDGVAAVVRAAVPFMQGEDKRVRERRLAAERSRRSYEKTHRKASEPHGEPSEPHASESTATPSVSPSEPHGEPSEPHGGSDGSAQAAFPFLPPEPPSNPAFIPELQRASRTQGAPTLEQVLSLLNSSINRVHPEMRPVAAQLYLDCRERTDPPWVLPATDTRRAVRLDLTRWEADCRSWMANWSKFEAENKFLLDAKLEKIRAGHGPPGKSSPRPPSTPREYNEREL